ncbi:MAG: MerR family transcriptional regulator [Gemmatimonadales bacterium]
MRTVKASKQPGAARLIPIGAVSLRTGLSQDVLRVWERRYHAVQPKRSADGNRVYEEADVARLELLKRATESGYAIGRVAALSADQLTDLLKDAAPSRTHTDKTQLDAEIAEIFQAVHAMNGARVNDLLMRSVVTRGAEGFVLNLLPVLLHQTGDLWEEGGICPAHEHLLSATLQRMLGWTMSQLSVPADAPVLIAVTPSGQRHEMGALMCGILAASRGWRVEYLGPDLPIADIARATVDAGARAVALSVVHRTQGDSLRAEMHLLRDLVGSETVIFVGGREGWRHKKALAAIGTTPLNSLDAFLEHLEVNWTR